MQVDSLKRGKSITIQLKIYLVRIHYICVEILIRISAVMIVLMTGHSDIDI